MKADNLVEWLKQWKQDRDAAIRSLDVETFKRFIKKWVTVYDEVDIPDDDRVLQVSLYKLLFNLESATVQEKEKAKKWLTEHGFDTNIYY